MSPKYPLSISILAGRFGLLKLIFMKKFWRRLLFSLLLITVLTGLFLWSIYVPEPNVNKDLIKKVQLERKGSDFFCYKNNWIRKSKTGLWEMYVEGKPFERGVINGKLSRKLVVRQENYFVAMLHKMIPNDFYINFLKYFVAWFNRDLDDNISEEYKKEIFGVSLSASPAYRSIGPNYYRILNYHAAHDIGHFLQEIHMVGCTSFSAWDSKTPDSSLIVGRNFDFYVGDDFARDKIVAFINPDSGNRFMMITWGGMIGAVSGMNEKGLTVTINAARSEIPTHTATPISIVAREVLQYASTVQEAFSIIKKRKTFVAQSFLIGSAEDHKAVVIEKSLTQTAIYETSDDYILCSNQFQSPALKNTPYNLEHIRETSTAYRLARISELVFNYPKITPEVSVEILRDRQGVHGEKVGLGNERALNQLQGHHSVIFKPEQKLVWVSTAPWQEGMYVAYDLNRIFTETPGMTTNRELYVDSLTIPADTFMYTQEFKNYLKYRKMKTELEEEQRNGQSLSDSTFFNRYISSNPDYYLVYKMAGDYYFDREKFKKADVYYRKALEKPFPWQADSLQVRERLKESEEQIAR